GHRRSRTATSDDDGKRFGRSAYGGEARRGRYVRRTRDPIERFEEKYIPEPNTGCWLWVGSTNNRGYGQFRTGGRPGVLWLAHRFSYKTARGSLSRDDLIRHVCDTPSCVNPDHLETGSYKDNAQDAIRRGRVSWVSQTHCVNGHEFTEENTLYRKSRPNSRECRACAKIRKKRFHEAAA